MFNATVITVTLIVGILTGTFFGAAYVPTQTVCAQSVVHKGNAVCAVFINKELADALK